MSSQSANEERRPLRKSTKKSKIAPVDCEKKARRNNRKNTSISESQNLLPANIPMTKGNELIVHRGQELQICKLVLQVPW